MNQLLEKAFYIGLGLAAVAKERSEQVIEELLEKGKALRKENSETSEQIEEEFPSQADLETELDEQLEAVKQAEEEQVSKTSILEEYEQKLRKLIDGAIARFNFIRRDDHQRIEQRIEALEAKLTELAQQAQTKNSETAQEELTEEAAEARI